MPRFPRPWSKKRGERSLGNALSGIAGEAAFYALVFLVGVFGISLILLVQFAPERAPFSPDQGQFAAESNVDEASGAVATNLSAWVFGTLSVVAIISGAVGLFVRLIGIGASHERRSVIADRAGSLEVIGGSLEVIGGSLDMAPSTEELGKLPSVPSGKSLMDSPGERLAYRLAVETPDQGGLIGPTLLSLLWNTVWFVLLAVVVSGFWFGRPRYFLTGLLVPFAGIGIWSFRFFLSQLRQRAGVGSTIVEISDHPLFPGGRYEVWVCQGGRLKLRRLTVQLTCEEQTFYRQGTDVRVERCVAFTEVLLRGRDVHVDPQQPWEQQLAFDLPDNVMHSFVGSHNAIRWKIEIVGESHPWPSFCRSFPVVVHPPGSPPRRSPR